MCRVEFGQGEEQFWQHCGFGFLRLVYWFYMGNCLIAGHEGVDMGVRGSLRFLFECHSGGLLGIGLSRDWSDGKRNDLSAIFLS